MRFVIEQGVPLAPRTTFGLGGRAELFVRARDERDVAEALAWAGERSHPVRVLGGGSNLLIEDGLVRGLVLAIETRGVTIEPGGMRTYVHAAAGEPWDALVARCVNEGLAGLECLSGIPGLVGATPIQNVGAYGQEVADTIHVVRAIDRRTGNVMELSNADCQFAYRGSTFKRDPEHYVVVSVVFALTPGGPPSVNYAELERALAGAPRDLRTVREAVIALRRAKSMVIDPDDPNRRSAGSFFTNPIVDRAVADRLSAAHPAMPHWLQPDGRTKLAAGWLIEQAGIPKGLRRGNVGISSRHALALVHHGGGSTRELLALAADVREAVRAKFGVVLEREPVLWKDEVSEGR